MSSWYSASVNRLYLRNNANTAWLGGFAPGSANTISPATTSTTGDCRDS